MKFPRRAKLFRNPFDMTAYAAVFFLMVIFLMYGTQLYTPGVSIELPVADNLPGTDRPTLRVALDENGQYYFQSQIISEATLRARLASAVTNSPEPLVLVIQADRNVRWERQMRLLMLARDVGITDSMMPAQPRP